MRSNPHNVVSTGLKNQGKIRGMFLLLISSQIVNLKMIGKVLVLKKCYQCGGETLVSRRKALGNTMRDSSIRLVLQITGFA